MQTLNLSENLNFTDDPYKNLDILYNTYGTIFNIQFEKYTIEISFIKYTTGSYKYKMIYNISDEYTYPLSISFEEEKKAYIESIAKTDTINGTDMVRIAIAICKFVRCKKAYLYDFASVMCDADNSTMDLSFIKLLEKNETFYMKNGFKLEKDPNVDDTELIKTINKCKSIKNIDIRNFYIEILELCVMIIKNQKYDKLRQYNDDYDVLKLVKPNVSELIKTSTDMINITNNDEYVYQTLIRLFNDKKECDKYSTLFYNLLYPGIHKLVYIDTSINIYKEIDFTTFNCFHKLDMLVSSSYYIDL